jgi:hypothetical protein
MPPASPPVHAADDENDDGRGYNRGQDDSADNRHALMPPEGVQAREKQFAKPPRQEKTFQLHRVAQQIEGARGANQRDEGDKLVRHARDL